MVVSGFGLSAFFFSTFAHTLFPGDTASLLLVLAIGSSAPMLLGFFIVRPIHHTSPHDLYQSIPAAESQLSIAEQWDTFSPVGATAEQEAIAHVRTSLTREESRTRRSHSLAREDMPFLLTDGISTYRGRSRSAVRMSLEIHDQPARDSRERERERSVSMHRDFIDATSIMPAVEAVDIHGMSLFGTLDFWLVFSILSLRKCYNHYVVLKYSLVFFKSKRSCRYWPHVYVAPNRIYNTALTLPFLDINNVGSIVQALLAAGNPSWNPVDGIERQATQVSIISVANSAGRLLIGTYSAMLSHTST